MPFRRPASPVSLETVSPPPSDLDTYGLLGSDDELDDSARTAKRRRIEKLADSYLQGSPLFILSASLKGPFDRNWVNPWKKDRKRNVNLARRREAQRRGTRTSGATVVQETDPRRRYDDTFKNRLQHGKTHTAVVDLDFPAPDRSGQSIANLGPSEYSRSSRDDRHGLASTSLHRKPKKSITRTKETQYYTPLAKDEHSSWLKKAPTRTGIRDFDPPPSPSAAVFARQLDTKDRREVEVSSVKGSSSTTHHSSPNPIAINRERTPHPPVDIQRGTRRSGSISVSKGPLPMKSSSSERQRISHSDSFDRSSPAIKEEPPLYIASSSSHLAKFEYRRPKNRVTVDEQHSRFPAAASLARSDLNKSIVTEDAKEPDPPGSATSKESSMRNTESGPMDGGHGNQPPSANSTISHGSKPKDSRSVSFAGNSKSESHTTSEKLPSGQGVPGNPNLADFVISLHSTAAPNGNSDYDGDTSPKAQFSTQAAVLLAQKSFQNDLDSPERNSPAISERDRQPPSHSPSSLRSRYSHVISPFSQINTPGRFVSKASAGNGLQMMSTQGIIDAVTPFTFSTEKKPNRYVGSPSRTTILSSKKRKNASFAMPSLPSSENSSPLSENRDESEAVGNPPNTSKSGIDASWRIISDKAPNADNARDDTQLTALPLTLTGSTPPTAQDGQGAIDSFNLNQAIADAGSWLQQSWDFSKDLKHCSSKTGPPSSAARRSALSLDTVN